MQGALYFPYVEVPTSAWFTRTLLYWDQVGTIVPDLFRQDPDRMSTYMRTLVESELLRQVDPLDGGAYVMQRNFERYLNTLSDDELSNRRAAFELDEVEAIHQSKFLHASGLMGLRKLRLVKRSYDRDLVLVERRTASEFMAALAMTLCEPDQPWQANVEGWGMAWVPTTDIPRAAEALVNGLAQSPSEPAFLRMEGHQRTDQVRVDLLGRLLPVPVDPVPVERLLAFRRRYGDLLPQLRRYMETTVDAAADIEDAAMRQRHVDRVAEELEERTKQAAAYMEETFQRRIVASKVLRWARFLPFVGKAAEATRDVADSVVTQRDFRAEPLAYLAFAHTDFGPKVPPFKIDPFTGSPLIEAPNRWPQ